MRGRYQGGSLAGFISIGVVLALVLVGGLYGLNRYNAEQSKEVATGSNDNSDKQANDKKAPESDSKTEESPKQSTEESTGKEDTETATGQSESTNNTAASPDDGLPATGPADTVAAMIAVAALGFGATHYIQSRSRNHQ